MKAVEVRHRAEGAAEALCEEGGLREIFCVRVVDCLLTCGLHALLSSADRAPSVVAVARLHKLR